MTNRTMDPEKTPIEKATERVVEHLNDAIKLHARLNNIRHEELRRIIALYFERMTLREWCELLGLADMTQEPEGPGHNEALQPDD